MNDLLKFVHMLMVWECRLPNLQIYRT
jgi:hypothetical protein